MKVKEKEELENKASRLWNEALAVKGYGHKIVLMQDAIHAAPTQISKKFYRNELKKIKGE